MYTVILEAQLRIGGCDSLKEKRHIVKHTITQLRKLFLASVSETGQQDKLDRLQLGVAVACSDMPGAQSMLQSITDWVYENEQFINADVVGEII